MLTTPTPQPPNPQTYTGISILSQHTIEMTRHNEPVPAERHLQSSGPPQMGMGGGQEEEGCQSTLQGVHAAVQMDYGRSVLGSVLDLFLWVLWLDGWVSEW